MSGVQGQCLLLCLAAVLLGCLDQAVVRPAQQCRGLFHWSRLGCAPWQKGLMTRAAMMGPTITMVTQVREGERSR